MSYQYLSPGQADPVRLSPSVQRKLYMNVISVKIQSTDRMKKWCKKRLCLGAGQKVERGTGGGGGGGGGQWK